MLDIHDVCARLDCTEKAVRRMVESKSLIPAETNPMAFSEAEVQRVEEEGKRQRRLIRQVVEMDEELGL